MKVNIVKLTLPDEVLQEVKDVLKSGMWAGGKPVASLEKEFSDYCGVKYCKAVNNGTAALMSIFGTLGLKPGDEVIIPSFSFIATANCLIPFGLKPVFADIDPQTYTLDPESVREKISPKTKAIMPVHLYGLCADMDAFSKIAAEHNLFLVDDACQAHGAEYKGKKAGSLGIASGFSLYPTKNMFCGGEGGLVTTNDETLYGKISRFINHGQSQKYIHTEIGYNFRMNAVSGVVARYSLKMLDLNNQKRVKNAELYNDLLSKINQVETPICPKGFSHVYHQYTIRCKKRDKLAEFLHQSDIGFGIHYKIPIHKQQFYKNLGYDIILPETEKASSEVISLPIHPMLTEEEIHYVASKIKDFYL